MSGPYRGNKNIVKNYNHYFGQYDLFVSCFEHYYQDWKSSDLKIKEIFTTPKIEIEKTKWYQNRDNNAGQSGFWQFWNLKSVIEQTPDDYDFYIKNRCDLFFSSSLNLEFDNLNKNSIYSSAKSFHLNEWNEQEWINDEFYVGDRATMNVISRFVLEYYEIDRHSKNDTSNEVSLLNFLKENKISINKIFDFIYVKNHNGVHISTGYTGNYQLEKL